MPCSGRDQDGVTRLHVFELIVDLHLPLAFEDEIKFLTDAMVMTLSGAAGGDGGLSQRLIFNRGVGEIQQTANGRTVFGGKRRLCGDGANDHGLIKVLGECGKDLNCSSELNIVMCSK